MIKSLINSICGPCFIAISLVLLGTNLKAQGVSKEEEKKAIVEFRMLGVDSCFMNILEAVVLSDPIGARFPPTLYCYQLSFLDAGSYCQIIIVPFRWNGYLPLDCKSVIECNHMLFLLCGKPSKYFFDNGRMTVNISYQKNPLYDSLDSKAKFTDWKVSPTAIVAEYKGCYGAPINLYINNGLNLKSYFRNPIE